MLSQEEIYARVSATLVEALNVDEEDIKPTATLQGDLGAESIDFLDIVFRLEREFNLKIPRGELFIESPVAGGGDYVQGGRATEEGLVALQSQMPYADLSDLERGRRLNDLSDLFTVDLLVRYIAWKLEAAKSVQATVLATPVPFRR